jgi:hypothetical protein
MPIKNQIRVTEANKKSSLTFKDLCDLVDKGREAGVEPGTVVAGDTYVTHVKGREGYVLKYLEV